MLALVSAALISTFSAGDPAPAAPPAPVRRTHRTHHRGHHKGCRSYRCDRRVTRRYRRERAHRQRVQARRLRALKWRTVAPYNAKLNRMARCESGGRWWLASGNGFYGGLQFVPSTWYSVGGRGMPHQATPLEQKYRAVLLIRRAGYSPWPVCGYR